MDNYENLPCEAWASFQLPKRAIELCQVKNYHQALPAVLCLHQKNFLLLPDSIFACQDIWEIQHEKMVVYAWALQFWVEKVNLPTGRQPCLLAGSLIELWEEMKCYLSFSDEDVFQCMALPEETPIIPPKEVVPWSTQPVLASAPMKKATMEPTAKKRPLNQYPGWQKVLHPSRPVVAAGEIIPLSRGMKQRPHSQSSGGGLVWQPQTKEQEGVNHPVRIPFANQQVGGCLVTDTTSWFCQCDCVSVEGPVTRRGLWITPRPVNELY